MNIDIAKAFSFAIERLKANPLFYIVGGLIIFGINFILSLIGNVFSFILTFIVNFIIKVLRLRGGVAELIANLSTSLAGLMIGFLLAFIIAPFFVGYFKGIKKECEGKNADITDIFSCMNNFVPIMLNYALTTVIVSLGLLFCIIPYFLLLPMIPLTLFFLAHDEFSGIEPVKKSFETLRNNPVLILWTLVFSIFAALGILLCCVGVFVTGPIAATSLYVVIAQATDRKNYQKERKV